MSFFVFFIFCGNASASTKAVTTPTQVKLTQQFLVLTDIHFDPFIGCTQKPCPLIQELQKAPAAQWNTVFMHHDVPAIAYGEDSNYALLESSLAAAAKEAKIAKVQFILVLGDFLAHNYNKKYFQYADDRTQAGYVAFVKKTMTFLTRELNRTFPQMDIYGAVGNNDSYEEDYRVEPQGLFFKDLSELWASWIKETDNRLALLQHFPQGGYYAVNAPHQPNLRLVFLNSVLFSNKAKGTGLTKAAEEQLVWLHTELARAQQRHQKVFIAMHVPTGIDVYTTLFASFNIIEFWKAPYSQRFLAEIEQAAAVVSGVFTAHLHADTFQIVTGKDDKAIPFSGIPSISPIFGNNPAFKIYSYSMATLHLVDFVTYYYSLNDKNEWQQEYDFDEAYQLSHHSDELINGMFQLQPIGTLADHYKTYYAVNSNSQPITKDNKWLPYYWCAIRGLTATQYRDCLSIGLSHT